MSMGRAAQCSNPSASSGEVSFVLALGIFLCTLAYIFVNPAVGTDYTSYLDLVEKIDAGLYFREPGFYLIVKFLATFMSAEQIIFLLRVFCFGTYLYFAYKFNSKARFLFLAFFLFVPNLYFQTLSSLQTALAISFLLWAMMRPGAGVEDWAKRILLILAFSLHYGMLLIVLSAVCVGFNRVLIFFLVLFGFFFVDKFIFVFAELFGYSKYLNTGPIEFGGPFFLTLTFLVFFFIAGSKAEHAFWVNVGFYSVLFLLFLQCFAQFEAVALLRQLNYSLPFVIVAIGKYMTGRNAIFQFPAVVFLSIYFGSSVALDDKDAWGFREFFGAAF